MSLLLINQRHTLCSNHEMKSFHEIYMFAKSADSDLHNIPNTHLGKSETRAAFCHFLRSEKKQTELTNFLKILLQMILL